MKPSCRLPLPSDIQPGDPQNETETVVAGHFETRTPSLAVKPRNRLAFKNKGESGIETERVDAQQYNATR